MKTISSLFFVTTVLFFLGLIMVFNTTSAEVIDGVSAVDPNRALIKQLGFSICSFILAVVVYCIGYKKIIENSLYIYLFSLFLLVCVFIPKIGMQINGAHRWISVCGFSFQPSELMKLALPLFFLQEVFHKKVDSTFIQFCIWQIRFVVALGLIIIEPDHGAFVILLATLTVLLFITEIQMRYWVIPMGVFCLAAVSFALTHPYVKGRIAVYLHPEKDLLGKGHQPYQAKVAAGSGGFLGRGLGESLQKYHYLPEARSDYIAAIFAEEFGFLGMSFLLLLYATITCLGFRIATFTTDPQGSFLASIFTFIISFQVFLNLGVVFGLLPSKGTNLPFFSQGGSSLLVNMLLVALLMNIYKEEKCLKKLPLQ